MKKLCILTIMALFLGLQSNLGVFSASEQPSTDGTLITQRGCCSRHGGVAGCNENGSVKCNDGTTSPTCKC